MSSTKGRLKGFISPERLFAYISEKYIDANHKIEKEVIKPISECKEPFKFYGDSTDWYMISDVISFTDDGKERSMFYHYSNVNFFEGLYYYKERGLEDMVKSEKTDISLGCFGNSVEIIKEIIQYFDGGWIDEDDQDSVEYYWVNSENENDNFKVFKKMVEEEFIYINKKEFLAKEVKALFKEIVEDNGRHDFYQNGFNQDLLIALEEEKLIVLLKGNMGADIFQVVNLDKIREYYNKLIT